MLAAPPTRRDAARSDGKVARLVPAATFFEMARRSQRMHLSDLQSERGGGQVEAAADGDDTASTTSTASTASTTSTACPLTSLRVFDPRDTRILENIARTRENLSNHRPSTVATGTPSLSLPLNLTQSKKRRQLDPRRHKCICMSSNVRQRIQALTATTTRFKDAAASAN